MCYLLIIFAFTRFSERVFVPDKTTRSLLKKFSKKGLLHDEFIRLDQLLSIHAPSLTSLFGLFKQEINMSLELLACPREWSSFIEALSSSSPVCALLHPGDKVIDLVKRIPAEDLTKDPTNMEALQKEVPVLFDILAKVSHLPTKALIPVIDAMVKKAESPFTPKQDGSIKEVDLPPPVVSSVLQDLAYFPSLPEVRGRGMYSSDRSTCVKGCTKQSTGHPSLLPGIFTLFCPHGECQHYTRHVH